MGFEGKVALVTGAARGQGRKPCLAAGRGRRRHHRNRCLVQPLEGVPYEMPGPKDLEATVSMVEERGRRVVSARADIRDSAALEQAVAQGADELGSINIVVANAASYLRHAGGDVGGHLANDDRHQPHGRLAHGEKPPSREMSDGGSVVLISSVLDLRPRPGSATT